LNDRQKVAVAAATVAAIVMAAAYTHDARERMRVSGMMFGNSLLDAQDNLKAAQSELAARVSSWEAGAATDAELLEYYEGHLARMDSMVARYGALEPPPGFGPAVRLFELSAGSQRDADEAHAEWVRTGDEQSRARSGALLQDAFEYESEALSAYADAQRGRAGP